MKRFETMIDVISREYDLPPDYQALVTEFAASVNRNPLGAFMVVDFCKAWLTVPEGMPSASLDRIFWAAYEAGGECRADEQPLTMRVPREALITRIAEALTDRVAEPFAVAQAAVTAAPSWGADPGEVTVSSGPVEILVALITHCPDDPGHGWCPDIIGAVGRLAEDTAEALVDEMGWRWPGVEPWDVARLASETDVRSYLDLSDGAVVPDAWDWSSPPGEVGDDEGQDVP